ncbi:hypothetical protein T4A_11129 [Trichinella pseudospiralis]|uniref:Uncharacterized protein n=1 Tax=Trichinella pseudospiralis TaxID=6337 RepID=A0A0V1F220_TRIPS|nr:hypothetical protein T4A_11129 [Trichinella pseudospiralis]
MDYIEEIVFAHALLSKSRPEMCELELITYALDGMARARYERRERSAKDTDETEIRALLCLPLLAGRLHSNRLKLIDLYNSDDADVEIFSSTVSLQRLECHRINKDLNCVLESKTERPEHMEYTIANKVRS